MSGSERRGSPSAEDQRAYGRQRRKAVPRRTHGAWTAPPDRPDPISLLKAEDTDRFQDLVPIRWGRMSVSPFTFFRGSAALMAADLAPLPRTELSVQLCGDAHLSNFGMFASPERTLMFDVNDFDETFPGPFEWDIKRLAASFVVAARNNAFSRDVGRDSALAAARSYRQHMAAYAEMRELDVWYSRVVADDVLRVLRSTKRAPRDNRVRAALAKARSRDNLHAAGKMTEIVDGVRRIVDQPPLIMHFEEHRDIDEVLDLLQPYGETLTDARRTLLDRFDYLDVARKVVGVGSVGTHCFIMLMRGRDQDDPLLLQIKEATRSVLAPYLGESRYEHQGHRVVAGQRLMQAASDIFLGWMTGPNGSHFYWRQLRDMKGSFEIERVRPAGLEVYAEVCGWALARGHARSGQRIAISAYLGGGDRFDRAIADFAESYADQVEKDFDSLLVAIKQRRVPVMTGI